MSEADPFEPYMPEVDVPADVKSVFRKARAAVVNAGSKEGLAPGQRCIGIVTPGRMVMFLPAPKTGAVPDQFVAQVKALLPGDKPLNIAAISFTALEPLMQGKAKCIPMLGQLLGFAYIGHHVLVFEGHPTALEHAVADCDVLWIDSAMLPFLQKDWIDVAYRVMPDRPRIFVFDRKTTRLHATVKSQDPQGWRYSEPDGEASYINCLLTTLAKRSSIPVRVSANAPVPDLAQLTSDAKQLEWIQGLPFQYDRLDPAKAIGIMWQVAKLPPPAAVPSKGILQAQVAIGAGKREKVSFHLTLSTDGDGRLCLDIQKAA